MVYVCKTDITYTSQTDTHGGTIASSDIFENVNMRSAVYLPTIDDENYIEKTYF